MVNENRRLIEYTENGFEDLCSKSFYSFQSVVSVESIKIKRDDDFCDIKLGICNYDNAYARLQYYFNIKLNDNRVISIGYDYGIKLYERVPRKNKFMQCFLGDKYVKNKQLKKFYSEQTDEMKEDMEILKEIREEFMLKFNQWKVKN